MVVVGEEDSSNHGPLDWMMYGNVHKENLSQGLIGEGGSVIQPPVRNPCVFKAKLF